MGSFDSLTKTLMLGKTEGRRRRGWQRMRWLNSITHSIGFPYSSVGKESTYNAGDLGSIPWFGKIPWKRDRPPTPVFLGFPCGSAAKESACNAGSLGLIPRLGRSPGDRKGYPLQYSGLENSKNCIVHGVTKSQTQLREFHFHFSHNGHEFEQTLRDSERQRRLSRCSPWGCIESD